MLDEIADMVEEFRVQLCSSPRWQKQLQRWLTASAVRGSTAIEGFVATVDDVSDIIVGESPLETDDKTVAEIVGYQQAMTFIQRLADAEPDFAYSKGLLNSLHYMMQGHHRQQQPGWWRTSQVYVTSPDNPSIAAYTAPETGVVPELMTEYVNWLNSVSDTPVLVRAAMAHLNLVAIHPWRDGNGRMSRSLQTLVLARDGIVAPEFCSIEEWLGRSDNTLRYYDVLANVIKPTWTPTSDTHPWIVFCLRAHHQQAQYVRRNVNATRMAWSFLEETIDQNHYPERMIYALYPACMQHRVRRSIYQIDAECSEQQAQRDLRQLLKDGWLKTQGEAQNRFYIAGPKVPDKITREITEPRHLEDPYQK